MDSVHYRDADEGDAETLAALFSENFTETFGHLYKPSDLAAFLADHTPVHWREQLRSDAFAVRLAQADGAIVGFAKMGPLKLPVEPSGPATELRQLYMAPQVRGSGAAATLMDWCLQQALDQGAQELFLSVYTDNERAKRFYAKYGFVEVGNYEFMVGSHADQDIIMRRPVSQGVG